MPLPDFMRDYLEDATAPNGASMLRVEGHAGPGINQFTAPEFRDLLVAFKELQDKVERLDPSVECANCKQWYGREHRYCQHCGEVR